MYNKILFILVEGNDDERFFEQIVSPHLSKKYCVVKLYKYASKSKEKNENFVKSIVAMKADYILVADNDKASCVTLKKEALIKERVPNASRDRIVIVIEEIESWYMAGLPLEDRKKLGIKKSKAKTADLTKEEFDNLIPHSDKSRIVFMKKVLNAFQIEAAARNNESFKYFVNKFGLL